jgi:hypothetical protein
MTHVEVVTLSEITQESIPAVESKVSGISADLETMLQAQIALWNENHNDVDMTLSGNVNLVTQDLLNAITTRVRVWLGFPRFVNSIQLPGTVVISSSLGW